MHSTRQPGAYSARRVELRDYQKACLRAIEARAKSGVRRQLVCLPTGTGKTVVFAELPKFTGKRVLVLAHREELLVQARDKLLRANPRARVDIEQGELHASAESEVVVASVATLSRPRRLARMKADEFEIVVVDEAHHATASTYRRVLEHFDVARKDTQKLLVGFTATPKRGDGVGLHAVFDEIVFSRALPEMIAAGYLVPLAGYRVETDIDLSAVKVRAGDYVTGQLSEAVNTPERNALVVRSFLDRLCERPTLCFCVDVAHAEELAAAFRDAGTPAAAVSGEMDSKERAETLAAFREGRLRVLTNCMVLTEGFDEPTVAGILLARPTRSALLYTQMIGRATRLAEGKADAIVVDVADVTREHKLVSLASLFGLPSGFDLRGSRTADVERAIRWAEQNRPWVRVDRATSLEDLRYRCERIDLLDLEMPEEIQPVTDFAWVGAAGGYRLGFASGAINVTPTILDEFEVVLQWIDGKREELGRCDDLVAALALADRVVRKRFKDELRLVDRWQRWREEPASEKQVGMLERRGIAVPEDLSKGQASLAIGMLLSAERMQSGSRAGRAPSVMA